MLFPKYDESKALRSSIKIPPVNGMFIRCVINEESWVKFTTIDTDINTDYKYSEAVNHTNNYAHDVTKDAWDHGRYFYLPIKTRVLKKTRFSILK